ILEQKPLPETEISSPIQIAFVVSRGPEQALAKVPDLGGLTYSDALLQIEKSDLVVKFAMRSAGKGERAGIVASQTPAAGTMIQSTAVVSVVLTKPTPEKGMVADVYARELPAYPYPLRVALESIDPDGERIPVMTVDHPGGLFTAPYVLPEDSVLVLTVLDREVPPRVQVKKVE
ncbi:MAG: PASTA domain-containing protein, partial [Spirochaetaceae bacterium]|nr:PASTA domain-containing protein [Spirochaetaceae bacterium]